MVADLLQRIALGQEVEAAVPFSELINPFVLKTHKIALLTFKNLIVRIFSEELRTLGPKKHLQYQRIDPGLHYGGSYG